MCQQQWAGVAQLVHRQGYWAGHRGFSSTHCPNRLCGHQSSIQQVPWAQSLEFTRLGRKADHLPPSKWSNVAKEWVELYLISSSCRRYLHNDKFTFTELRLWATRSSGPSWDSYLTFQNPVVTCICIIRSPQILQMCGCHLHVVQRSVQTTYDPK